jgi:hypothetical protein
MIGISPRPTVITKGRTGPTRSGYDWNVQQSPGSTSNRWARRGGSAWNTAIGCQIIAGSITTITKLTINVYGTPLVTDAVTFTLQRNGVDTALSVVLAAGAATADGTGSVFLNATDYLTVRATQNGTELSTTFWVYIFASDGLA